MASKEERATQFLTNAKGTFGERYDYSKVHYQNNRTHVTIICPEHGDFHISPGDFLTRKIGCPHCGRRASIQKRQEKYRKKEQRKPVGQTNSMSEVIQPSTLI
ncbi:DUF723 domain-containing protein [Vibrio maritimus]|uniref:DUF723 domain-containing protein n=1 Tax=Vibrio maritimus TaxID=990268 RepID=UPI004067EB17